jgi:hypothetical protein
MTRQIIYRALIVSGLAILSHAAVAKPGPTDQAPLPEAAGPTIEYPSVAAALKALHVKAGVVFTTENGWTIATDEAAYTIWSFAPPTYPAYPAVVKRQAIARGSGSEIAMDVQCEASKEVCDDLVRTFVQMNRFGVPK